MGALWGLGHNSLCAHTDCALWGCGSNPRDPSCAIRGGLEEHREVPRFGLASGLKLGAEVKGGAGSPHLSAMSAGLMENIWQYL